MPELPNRQILLRRRPTGLVQPGDTELVTTPAPEPADGEALVRTTYVGIDAAARTWLDGQPGYLRVDTVHQGDLDGAKGVYHINAVDEVTQWQVVACVSRISEAWLQPVLQAMLKQFPFAIRGFHSDNGSEFVNTTVAQLDS